MRWNCSGVCASLFVCVCSRCLNVLLHCECWWKCDCDPFTVSLCLCLAKVSLYYIGVCISPRVSPLVLETRLHYCCYVLSFIFLAIRRVSAREYIMLYNIIYKLHRINLCHLRHMNFTVYTHSHSTHTHFRKSDSMLFFYHHLLLLSCLYLVLSHFAGLCYYCHPVHRISVYFQHCTPSMGERVCSICHLHWWTGTNKMIRWYLNSEPPMKRAMKAATKVVRTVIYAMHCPCIVINLQCIVPAT